MIEQTYSFPPCKPDHPYPDISSASLAYGACPKCGGLLNGRKAARQLQARRVLEVVHERDEARAEAARYREALERITAFYVGGASAGQLADAAREALGGGDD